ncbi:hypothetical protein FB45DRAFT_1006839, partial [Roridomyces roridus]
MDYGYLWAPRYYTDAELDQMRKARNEAIRNVYTNWFTDPSLTGDDDGQFPWSTMWKDFELVQFWLDRSADGQLKIDKLLKETWVVPGTIEMLAFLPICGGPYFLFAAGGEYYYWNDHVLLKHSRKFGSHQEFVHYAMKPEGSQDGLNLPHVEMPQAVETDFLWWDE